MGRMRGRMGQETVEMVPPELVTVLPPVSADAPREVTTAEVNEYFARASSFASGGVDWAVANPLLALGVGIGLLMLFSRKR